MTLAQELEALIAKATPGDLSTAEVVGGEETVECPLCTGVGEVPQDAHYTNFDAVALGVQFFGIGPHFDAHQALWSWLMKHRETILAALKDRDVVLEEAAKVAEDIAHEWGKRWRCTSDKYETYDNGRIAGWSDRAADAAKQIRNLKERV